MSNPPSLPLGYLHTDITSQPSTTTLGSQYQSRHPVMTDWTPERFSHFHQEIQNKAISRLFSSGYSLDPWTVKSGVKPFPNEYLVKSFIVGSILQSTHEMLEKNDLLRNGVYATYPGSRGDPPHSLHWEKPTIICPDEILTDLTAPRLRYNTQQPIFVNWTSGEIHNFEEEVCDMTTSNAPRIDVLDDIDDETKKTLQIGSCMLSFCEVLKNNGLIQHVLPAYIPVEDRR